MASQSFEAAHQAGAALSAALTHPVRPLRAYSALVIGVLCISFTAIFTKWAAMPGPVSATWRMAVATLALAVPFMLNRRRSGRLSGGRLRARDAAWGAAGGVWLGVNLAMLNSALLLTAAATATLLDNMASVWVGLGTLVFFHGRLRGRYWVGLGVALVGAAVVTGFNPTAMAGINRGDLLAFVGSTCYAGYLLTTQRGRRDLDALSYLWLVVASAGVVLLGISLAMRLPLTGYPLHSYAAMIGAGLLSQSAGWFLINYALGYLPASSAVVVLLAQPIIVSVISIPLLHESLRLPIVLGGAFLLTGIYLCVRSEGNRSFAKQ
jgi:drug/metabolite transporter (DMT)-like permease